MKADSMKVKNLIWLARYFETNDIKLSQAYYKQADVLSQQVDYPMGIVKVCEGYTVVANMMGNYDKALPFLERGLKVAQAHQLPKGQAMMLGDIGAWYLEMGDFKRALHYTLKALSINEKVGRISDIGFNLSNAAGLFQKLGSYDKAKDFNLRTIKLLEDSGDLLTPMQAYSNLGGISLEQKNYTEAKNYFSKALELTRQSKQTLNTFFEIECLDGLGNAYVMLKESQNAKKIFEQALNLAGKEAGENAEHYCQIQASLANLYFQEKAFVQSEKAAYEAIKKLPKARETKILPVVYPILANLSLIKGDMKQWEHFEGLADSLNKKLLNEEIRRSSMDVEAKYNLTKKEKELLQKDIEIKTAQNRNRLLGGGALVLLLLGASAFYVYQKRQQTARLQAQLETQSQERNRISREMHDELGANLTSLIYSAHHLRMQVGDNPLITKIIDTSGDISDKMNEIVWALSQTQNTLPEWVQYVRGRMAELLENANLNYRFDIPETFPNLTLTNDQRRNLYLVVKEAVHNAIKHSKATEIKVKMEFHHDLFIEITDNGEGFTKTKKNKAGSGNGLSNMKQRMAEIGGTIDWESDENGTKVLIKA